MPSILGFVLTLSILGFSLMSNANPQKFDFDDTKQILQKLADDPPVPRVTLKGQITDPKARAFFDYYQNTILPMYLNIGTVYNRMGGLMVLIDGGFYKDDAERDQWIAKREMYQDQSNLFQTDEKVEAQLKRWSELAEGLTGELPDEARRDYHDRVKWNFAADQHTRLNELDSLKNEFDLALADAEANDKLADIDIAFDQAINDFKDGKMAFAEAKARLDEIVTWGGYKYVAQEALDKHPDHQNRMAVLRSELAKTKGFKTWADYRLENDDSYDVAFRGVKVQKQFLTKYIAKLAPKVREMLDARAGQMGLDPNEVTARYQSLIYPKNTQALNAYFPPEKITSIFMEAMKESGFSDHTLNQIIVDDEIRPKKNLTMAYQARLMSPYLAAPEIDAATLNNIMPPREDALWNPAVAYILQSYKAGGAYDLETMFHEGGHALEMILKHKGYGTSESAAYVETPSTSLETFLKDPEFLVAKATPVDGKALTLEEARTLVQNDKMKLASIRLHTAATSLFDIELWDYDYSAPGAQTFMQRLKFLNDEMAKWTLERKTPQSGNIPGYVAQVATDHHYSGDVSYIGYTLAELSSQQMVSFFRGELEKQTGRRSVLNQPGLAKILGDDFYAQGWKTSFPTNIEKITGRKFDPEVLAEEFFAELESSIQTCEKALK